MKGLDTINTAKQFFRDGLRKGIVCPCCNRFAKIYSRKLNNAMAIGLAMFYDKTTSSGQVWIHMERFFKGENCKATIRGDFTKLRYWELIELNSEKAGFYRITQKGIDFLNNKIKIPKSALIYNDEVLGFSEKQVSVNDVVKEFFDFEVLMKSVTTQRKLNL